MEIINNDNEDHLKYILKFIDWPRISKSKMSESFIERFKDNLDWGLLCDNKHFSENFYENEKYSNYVDWRFLCRNRNFPEDFYERHLDKVDWDCLSARQDLPESFFERHLDKIEYTYYLECNPSISEEFKKKYIKNYGEESEDGSDSNYEEEEEE